MKEKIEISLTLKRETCSKSIKAERCRNMKTTTMLVLFFMLASFSYSQKYSPIPPDKVKIYTEHNKPENFEVLGIVSASTEEGLSKKKTQEKNIKKLQKAASEMGANGVIIDETNTSTGALMIGTTFVASSTYHINGTAIRLFENDSTKSVFPQIEENKDIDVSEYKFYYPIPNDLAETVKIELARENLTNAYKAYNIDKDLKSTKFYLDQCQKNGVMDAAFYYLLGRWAYDNGDKRAAMRYWQRGPETAGCEECIDLYTAVKFEKSILPAIEQHKKKWESD